MPDRWTIAFLGVIYLARVCHGIYMSVPGPTLLYLAANVDASVQDLAPMFSGRPAGMLLGAVAAAFVLQYERPMASLGFAVFMSGAFILLIPFVNSVALLTLMITGGGVMAGYLDAGMQAMLLRLWGEKDSRSHIQAFHFAFTIGASIAPLIVRPFLIQASQVRKDGVVCPRSNTTLQSNITSNAATIPDDYFNPVGWAFVISAVYMFVISLLFVWLTCTDAVNKIQKIRKSRNNELEARPQQKFAEIWYIAVLVVFFYLFMIGGEHPYVAYIYSIVVCALGFSESNGSYLNTVFWSGMAGGRLTGTIVAKFFLPRTIIVVCLIGCLCSMLFLCLFGHLYAAPWIASFFYAFFISPLYPSCVSWVSKFINTSGKYLFIFNLGNSIGSMSMTALGGVIFQRDPFSVIYFSTTLIGCHCITFVAMLLAEKYFTKNNTKKQDSSSHQEADPLDL